MPIKNADHFTDQAQCAGLVHLLNLRRLPAGLRSETRTFNDLLGYGAETRSIHRGQWLRTGGHSTETDALSALVKLALAEYSPADQARLTSKRDCPLFDTQSRLF